MRLALLLVFASSFGFAQHTGISPTDPKPVGPYSPGVAAGDFIYVSGQGPIGADGKLPASFDQQVQQTLANVDAVLKAGKVTSEHVVMTTVYLTDMKNYDAMNKAYSKYFGQNPPARMTIGVTRLPRDIAVEISAIAVRDRGSRKPLQGAGMKLNAPVTPAIEAGDRVFMSTVLGRTAGGGKIPKGARAQVEALLQQAGLALGTVNLQTRNLAFATVYATPRMNRKVLEDLLTELLSTETARTVIQTDSLPDGADVALAGIASKSFRRMGRCNQIGDSLYCTGRAGTIRQVMNELKADLGAAGASLADVVNSTVFVANMDEYAAMNKIYGEFFTKTPPARATIQPWKTVTELALAPATGAEAKPDDSPRTEVVVIAVKAAQK